MRYAHILLAFASECWAMQPDKLDQLVSFLALQAAGEKLSVEEVQARITKEAERGVARRDGAVAVLPLRGVIANRISMMSDISGGTSSEGFGRMFDAAVADEAIKAIVLDVDSPGGTVSGTDELSAKIFAARGRKPIVAHVNAKAASAAYWIATAADEVIVTSSGEVGSIGVFTVHDDVSAAMEKLGIKKTLIGAGRYKAEGAPFLPLAEETRDYLQARVDLAHDQFIRRVASNRGVSQTKVREDFGQGRMLDAGPAVAAGMVDGVATLDETLARFGVNKEPAPKRRALAPAREKRALELT